MSFLYGNRRIGNKKWKFSYNKTGWHLAFASEVTKNWVKLPWAGLRNIRHVPAAPESDWSWAEDLREDTNLSGAGSLPCSKLSTTVHSFLLEGWGGKTSHYTPHIIFHITSVLWFTEKESKQTNSVMAIQSASASQHRSWCSWSCRTEWLAGCWCCRYVLLGLG